MDITTRYLNMELKNPFVPSSTPLSKNISSAKQLEDCGAPALIMHSLFQEEIEQQGGSWDTLKSLSGSAGNIFGSSGTYVGPDHYLKLLQQMKSSMDIPIIASMNGTAPGKWLEFSRELEQAGADALEVNVYYIAADITEPAAAVEQRLLTIFKEVRSRVALPITLKLSPYYSSIGHVVKQLEAEGAQGVSLFNRFYQPNIDLETQEISGALELSTSNDALLAMRWIAILYGRTSLSLAATGGIHFAEDALKTILCGADVTHLGSTLLANGSQQIERICEATRRWLEEHECHTLSEIKGKLSQQNAADPAAFERGYYLRLLSSFKR